MVRLLYSTITCFTVHGVCFLSLMKVRALMSAFCPITLIEPTTAELPLPYEARPQPFTYATTEERSQLPAKLLNQEVAYLSGVHRFHSRQERFQLPARLPNQEVAYLSEVHLNQSQQERSQLPSRLLTYLGCTVIIHHGSWVINPIR